jgi:hypothetical protein
MRIEPGILHRVEHQLSHLSEEAVYSREIAESWRRSGLEELSRFRRNCR